MGALVGITAACALVSTLHAAFIGVVGSFIANISAKLLIYLQVDDAVGNNLQTFDFFNNSWFQTNRFSALGATCVHGFGGAWGMIAVGLFARDDPLEGVFL